MENVEKCPFSSKSRIGRTNQEWWADRLNLNAPVQVMARQVWMRLRLYP